MKICPLKVKTSAAGAALAALLLGAVGQGPGLAQTARSQTPPSKKNAPKSTPASATKEALVPFRSGETLTYRVAWAAFSAAASLQVSVPERRNLFGWSTWHFRAALHTQPPVRTLFTIDDEFDSYGDTTTLETRQYETYQDELGHKENRIMRFVPAGEAGRGPGPEVVVLPGTRDPVGAFFALRSVDWQHSAEFRVPLYDGHDIYQLIAKLDAKDDMVNVAAGSFSASRVAVRLSQKNSGAPDISFLIWLSNDSARVPVQLQAQLPFGSIRAELMPGGK
jgi:uncharacterized protein DUF3108